MEEQVSFARRARCEVPRAVSQKLLMGSVGYIGLVAAGEYGRVDVRIRIDG